MIAARFIDVGVLEPAWFHATYTGIALAMEDGAPPVVVWGRARPHISLGQSQAAEVELAPHVDVPVVRRPLGGGAVWVDENQHCYVLVAPLSRVPPRPADWFEWGLKPAVATYRRFCLAVGRVDQDLWLKGRKIAGSGAATIGACAVLASSFLIRFPAQRFARCVNSPSVAYREWLAAGLSATMTDWESHQRPPVAALLRRAYRAAIRCEVGWSLGTSTLRASERVMRQAALQELTEPGLGAGHKLVRDGIKLNARSFLTETSCGSEVERVLNVGGAVVRHEHVPAYRA
jgi:lipoate-protein ligase A